MKKMIVLFLSIPLFLVLSACSSQTDNGFPPDTVPISQSGSLTAEFVPTTSAEKAASVLKNADFDFIVGDGGGDYIKENPTAEEVNYIGFNCAYISYDKPDAEPSRSLMKIKAGDKLDNGLTVEWTNSVLSILNDSYSLSETTAGFKGELTLIGTLECTQEDSPVGVEKGSLSFKPDDSNEISLPCSPQQAHINVIWYDLGNINDEDLPEGITEIVNTDGKETAIVKVVISDIKIHGAYNKTGVPDTAILVKVEKIG